MGMSPHKPRRLPAELGIQPVVPGQYLKEWVLPARGLDVRAAAEVIGLSLTVLKGVLCRKTRVDGVIADKLSKFTGTSAMFWLNMQEAADLAGDNTTSRFDEPRTRRAAR